MYGYLFGPVPSRRLGRSLGVDLVPAKTCCLDCVYCESGGTTALTALRREYVPTDEVIAELDGFLSGAPSLDYITFSGAGEPTLHSGIGRIIRHIKEGYPRYNICLLTNGCLLGDDALIEELRQLDLIIPSLDAADEAAFRRINRPAPGLSQKEVLAAIVKFRKSCRVTMWLEIFIVPGLNDTPDSIAAFKEAVSQIMPDKIELNTLDRPGTEGWVQKAGADSVGRFKAALESISPVQVVGRFKEGVSAAASLPPEQLRHDILEMLSRRPCTAEDIASSFGAELRCVEKALSRLLGEGRVSRQEMARGTFYKTS